MAEQDRPGPTILKGARALYIIGDALLFYGRKLFYLDGPVGPFII